MAQTDTDGPPRAALIAALAVAVVAIGAVLAVAATREPTDTAVVLGTVPAPQAASQACDALLAKVPDTLGEYRRATIADPAPPGAMAWRTGPGTEPVTLRCGVDSPGDFVVGTPIQMVDDVSWFRVGDEATGLTTWFAIDRPVIVALTLPNGSGPTPIQEVTRAISASLPVQPVTPGPPR